MLFCFLASSKKNTNETDEETKTSSTAASSGQQHHHHSHTYQHHQSPQHQPQRKRRSKKARDVKYTHTLTSLCIISHHPFFSLFRECLNILRRIIEACHARALASSKPGTPSKETPVANKEAKSRDTVWGILTGSSGTLSTEQISSLVACEIREIETWVLRLLSAPVPVPGKTKLIVNQILNTSKNIN